jgi:hypothetical protein
MARSAREDGFRMASAAGARLSVGSRSVISGRGVRGVVGRGVDAPVPAAALLGGVRGETGMAHCGVEGDAGATARRLGVPPPAVGERGGVACDSGLDGVVRGMAWRAGARGKTDGREEVAGESDEFLLLGGV